jgi:hypothetical protein
LNKKERSWIIKNYPIENRQYIYISRFLDSPERNNRSPFWTSLGSWGKVYFIKTSPYLKQIFNYMKQLFGRETQRFLHKLVGYKSVRGWEYQIQNVFSTNSFFFSKDVAKFENEK